jgi:hypothetical protein
LNAVSTGTKIFNNIFYTKHRTLNIKIYEEDCLNGFESDYNLFWCESGEPLFEINYKKYTFTQWQAMGYDQHSVVINPSFVDFTDFVPQSILEYGKDLGTEFQSGLSVNAVWSTNDPELTDQGIKWQVGARLHPSFVPEAKILFYPNPASDVMNILINDQYLAYNTVKIFDLQGRILYTGNIHGGNNIFEIPKYIVPGLYNFALEANQLNRYIKKIVIIR